MQHESDENAGPRSNCGVDRVHGSHRWRNRKRQESGRSTIRFCSKRRDRAFPNLHCIAIPLNRRRLAWIQRQISTRSTTDNSQSHGYTQGGTVRAHRRETEISDSGNILMFDQGVRLDLRNEPQGRAKSQLMVAERMSAIGRMACSISHDIRHSLSAIYANAEFLERHDICASARADLLLEIQEAVLEMTERIDSLLQFGRSGRKSPLVHERVSIIVEKAVAAVKFHPD